MHPGHENPYNADGRLSASGTAALKYNAFGERAVETITGGGTHFLFGPDGYQHLQ